MYGLKEIVAMNQEHKDLGMQILTQVLEPEVVEDCPVCSGTGKVNYPFAELTSTGMMVNILTVPCAECHASGIKIVAFP